MLLGGLGAQRRSRGSMRASLCGGTAGPAFGGGNRRVSLCAPRRALHPRDLRVHPSAIGASLNSAAAGHTIRAKTSGVGSTFPELGGSGPTCLQLGGRASVLRVEDGPMKLLGPSP